MAVQGLPPGSLTLAVQSLDVLYNGADKITGSKLNWAGITGTNFDVSATVSTPMSTIFAGITNTTDISVAGTLQINVADTVIGSAPLAVAEKSGLTVNDGSVNVTNASELVIKLTNLNLFVGTGATVSAAGIDTTNATGFSVSGANLDVAIIGENKTVATPRQ